MKHKLLMILLACSLAGCGFTGTEDTADKTDDDRTADVAGEGSLAKDAESGEKTADQNREKAQKNKDEKQIPAAAGEVVISGDGSPATIAGVPIVNKKYGVSPDYAPGEDPTAAAAARELIAAMQSQGLDVSDSWSGFRSYEYQSELYNGYVASSGQEAADTFSARPGFSEHQTGLAFDLKHASGALLENPAEAQWLLDHAHEYGFIVRYQEGWESITGYMAEPWHIRYVGDIAEDIHARNIPLETFLGAEGGDYR
ncbi:M15 family metallopeptidase [Faecalibaculum rodentium]|uniref:M15 family metallopeptidase n=1 Tax=Faecalibaculum rodentium TaxID=1702221 RepID=UPI0025742125|nr:M15 family metallopeptidase [Faecalibaculum rodentium]